MSQILDLVKLIDFLVETIERARQKLPSKNMSGAAELIELLVLTNDFFKTLRLIKT